MANFMVNSFIIPRKGINVSGLSQTPITTISENGAAISKQFCITVGIPAHSKIISGDQPVSF